MENYWVKFVIIMISMATTEICWGYYIIKVDQRKSFLAALFSAGIVAVGSFSIKSFVEDHSFVFASALGAFFGTFLTVEFEKYISKKKNVPDVNEDLEEEKFFNNPLDNIKGDTISDMIEKHSIKDESKVKSKIDYIDTFDKPDQINVDAKWSYNHFFDGFIYTSGRKWVKDDIVIQGQLLIDTGNEIDYEYITIKFHQDEYNTIYDKIKVNSKTGCIYLDGKFYVRLKV